VCVRACLEYLRWPNAASYNEYSADIDVISTKVCRNLKRAAVALMVKVDTAVPIQAHHLRLLTAVILLYLVANMPVPVAARSKGWVCGRSPAENVGSNPSGEHGRLWCVACFQLEDSVTS
jgi:hypothetical protein